MNQPNELKSAINEVENWNPKGLDSLGIPLASIRKCYQSAKRAETAEQRVKELEQQNAQLRLVHGPYSTDCEDGLPRIVDYVRLEQEINNIEATKQELDSLRAELKVCAEALKDQLWLEDKDRQIVKLKLALSQPHTQAALKEKE